TLSACGTQATETPRSFPRLLPPAARPGSPRTAEVSSVTNSGRAVGRNSGGADLLRLRGNLQSGAARRGTRAGRSQSGAYHSATAGYRGHGKSGMHSAAAGFAGTSGQPHPRSAHDSIAGCFDSRVVARHATVAKGTPS